MTDTPERDEDAFLAAEYVLGVLPQVERKAFATRIDREPKLQQHVRFWEQKLSGLTNEVEPVAPRADIKHRINLQLFDKAEAVSVPLLQRLVFWRALSAAAFAAFLFAVALPGLRPWPNASAENVYVAQIAGDAKQVILAAYFDQKAGVIRYNRTEGQAAAGRALELWAIIGKNKPVSLGVIPESQNGAIKVPSALVATLSSAVLALSDEPPGGSPTGQPTGAVLATGKLTAI